jgi:hypothetical protein
VLPSTSLLGPTIPTAGTDPLGTRGGAATTGKIGEPFIGERVI